MWADQTTMTDDHSGQAGAQTPSTRIPQRDFGWLAKQITRRTTDVLVILILGVGLLSVGGKLREWWQDDRGTGVHPKLAADQWLGHSLPWGVDGKPVAVDFGSNPYTVERQTLRGTAAEASQALMDRCRRHTTAAAPPATAANKRETALLHRLADHQPIASGGDWRLYRIDYPTRMFVGVRSCRRRSANSRDGSRQNPVDRVVSWGILFPFKDQQWTSFLFHPVRGSAEFDMPQFELPESAKQVMSIRSDTAGAILAFAGRGSVGEWQTHFDTWFAAHQGVKFRDWSTDKQSCTARFGLEQDAGSLWIDVVFSITGSNRLNGLLMATRQTSEQQRENP